ncbi:hypothetical protein DMENIID0001_013970 [Sergentomyia squamirostris]
MSNEWTRPGEVKFPSIWVTFQTKHPTTNESLTFRIQDLPEDRFDEAAEIMIEHFLSEEVMCKCKEISNDPDSLVLARVYYKEMISRKISLICVQEGSDEIAGINVLDPVTIYDKQIELPEGTDARVLDLQIASYFVMKQAKIFDKYSVDKYISAWGLFVFPKYRGMGLGVELLKARIPLGQAVGFKVTATQFTSQRSQAVAKKAGFIEEYVVSYEDLEKNEPHIEFPNITSPLLKVMALPIGP